MRFRYISDIHLERVTHRMPFIPKNMDIPLFLAGDIGNIYRKEYKEFLQIAADNSKHVFLVAGNHEYGRISTEHEFLERDMKMQQITHEIGNITLMNRTSVLYDSYIIAGCTLWTHTHFAMTPRTHTENERHFRDISFLEKCVKRAREENKNVLILTHHLPSYKLLTPYFLKHPLWGTKTYRWASHSEHLMCKNVKYWICGHSHVSLNMKILDTTVLMNASGGIIKEIK